MTKPQVTTPVFQHCADQPTNEYIAKLEAANAKLRTALERVLPMARACKHEHFSDMNGREDTKTEALAFAVSILEETDKPSRTPTRAELDAAMYPCLGCGTLKSGADGGSIYWWCDGCWNKELSATGGAR